MKQILYRPVAVLLMLIIPWFLKLFSCAKPSNSELQIRVRGIGQPCACDSDCDFSKWLTCQNGLCNCLKVETFIYDYDIDTCVVRLGEKCFEITQEYSEYNIVDLPPIVRCIKDSFCSMSSGGLCSCNRYSFYETLDGSACLPKKSYAEPCTRAIECESEVCSGINGQCICKIGEFYHKKRKKCVGLIGANCFSDDECLDNGICREYDARCDCRPGYSESLIRTCEIKLSYGEPCNLSIPCNNVQLSCIDLKCICKFSDYQFYNSDAGTCQTLVGGPCESHSGCVEFSQCTSVGLFAECQCVDDYLEMQNGRCMRFSGYGSICEASSECDPLANLVCKVNETIKVSQCDCRDSLKVYDADRRMCVGLYGSKCSTSPKDNSPCTENAVCVQKNLQLPGKCSCTPGSRLTSERTCVLD